MKPEYLVLDLETDGLDPNVHTILEVGAILVDINLKEINRFHKVLHFAWEEQFKVDKFVQNMHTSNRLWFECSESTLTVWEVENALISWLDQNKAEKVQLAGASIQFDRSFLADEMPTFLKLLSHRQVDISGVARELRACGLHIPQEERQQHRSIPDCESELKEWQGLRKFVSGLVK